MKGIVSTIALVLVLACAVPMATAATTPPSKFSHHRNRTSVLVAVQGVVLCKNCTQTLHGAYPVPGARVAVVCKDELERVLYYKTELTGKKGYFYHVLRRSTRENKFDPLVYEPLDFCEVKLVWSPLKNCNWFSNINNGINGGLLRLEKAFKRPQTNTPIILYSAGPFAFVTPPRLCPKPR